MRDETAASNPLVRTYLRELRAACAKLPPAQAKELREQITAHLDELLPPGASDQDVLQVLGRLGSPAQLAREAELEIPSRTLAQRMLARLAALSWRAWTAITVATAVVGIAAGSFIAAMTAAPLEGTGSQIWWFSRDHTREVNTSADGHNQTTVPIRSGQVQGFVVTVTNPGPWTQTVVGPGDGFMGPGGPNVRVGVSPMNQDQAGAHFPPQRYELPVAIPAGQTMAVRVLWTSTSCLLKGSSQGIDTMELKVRIGWVTRTETIPLGMGWFVSCPSHGRCI